MLSIVVKSLLELAMSKHLEELQQVLIYVLRTSLGFSLFRFFAIRVIAFFLVKSSHVGFLIETSIQSCPYVDFFFSPNIYGLFWVCGNYLCIVVIFSLFYMCNFVIVASFETLGDHFSID